MGPLYPAPHVHEVRDRQPVRSHRASQLRHKSFDLQVDFRHRRDFPPRRTGQWSQGKQPGRRLARPVEDGAIAGFHADSQRIRNRDLAVTQFRDERDRGRCEIPARAGAIDDMSGLEHAHGSAAQSQRDFNQSPERAVAGNAALQDFQRTGAYQFGERIAHAWSHAMPMYVPAGAQMT